MLVLVLALAFAIIFTLWLTNTVIVPDVGKQRLGEMLNGLATSPNLNGNATVRLYTAVSPALGAGSVAGDFTEPTYTGYAGVSLANPVAGSIDVRDQFPFTYDAVNFQPTAGTGLPQTAIGYFVTDNSDGSLLWAQPFSSSFVFTSTSSICTFVPVLETGQLDVP